MDYKLLNKIEDIIKACCDKDWTMIHANISSGLAMAASKAMRILGASHDIGVVTHE